MAAQRRALVTGGAGFLGSHLCERLLDSGYEVLCVDNLRIGALENIAHLIGRPRFSFLRHDIVEPIDAKADEIYNLACPASPVQYQEDPIQTLKSSVCGAMNLLELAQRTGAKILQASTSEVYGDPQIHPQSETYWGHVNPIGPRSCYDEGKRCAETFFVDYRRRRGVEARIARIFNTYGPRMQTDDGRVVSNFIVQALRGGAITVYGDGSQTRSFCYVTDLVEGLMRLMSSSAKIAAPVNLGNPQECTVLELARVVVRMTGSSSRIEFKPLPQDDPVRRCPDITTARSILKWTPRVSLQDGLMRTVDYFAARLGARAVVCSGAPRVSSGSAS